MNMDIENRQLTAEESEAVAIMFARKHGMVPTRGFVTTVGPVTLRRWNGVHPVDLNTSVEEVPVGSTLQIVMVSRFGDCGLTDDLATDYDYHVRLPFDHPSLSNIRLTAADAAHAKGAK